MFQLMAAEHKPLFAFDGKNKGDFDKWKKKALPLVKATLGDSPEPVAPNPQLLCEWEHDGLKKQKWLIDVQKHISATLLVNIPAGIKKGEKRAAIICCHGHGPFGKEPVMGNDSTSELKAQIDAHNYSYGHQMAQKGFVTYAIDWIGFGERNDNNKPNHRFQQGRDWCNLYYLHATMFGMTSLSINIAHGMAATSFVSSMPFVDKNKLGVMGLSGGGTMSLWTALCDDRIKAAEVICYSDLWAHFGIRDINYCGMQVSPGLYKLVDLPDLQGLLAPKPLLVDIGVYDECFKIDSSKACYDKVEKIYRAAGVSRNLELDIFPGQHAWGGNKAGAFFKKHLS
jgi:dienelactone hydrolase